MSVAAVKSYFLSLQETICSAIEEREPQSSFNRKHIEHERGLSKPQVLSEGQHIEKAAVHFTHVHGKSLPPAATKRKPELSGCAFEAVSISLIIHPRNPYAPTTHANLRHFEAKSENGTHIWWFGGGFDLTPYYGFLEDAVHWHQQAKKAVDDFGMDLYPKMKAACDQYFFLPHRNETRGVGGLFFEDYNTGDFKSDFALVQSVGDHFLPAYLPIYDRRNPMPYGQRERSHQLWRRGRYVEFNLLYDRGTKYGLQSGRRIESVMASMPPVVNWTYDHQVEADSEEAKLLNDFLHPRDWLEL